MTTIAYPTTDLYRPSEFTLTLTRNIVGRKRNPFTRRRQVIEHPGPLWAATIIYAPDYHADRAGIEAFWNRVSAAVNKVSMWHFARPTPRGTLQSNTTTAASASAGASAISLNATTGLTLLAGDMMEITLTGGATQLVMVVADVTSVDSVMAAVSFVPSLVGAVSNGATVKLVRASALFQLEEDFAQMPYVPGYAQSFPVTLIETPNW